ncbi:hypothetical protein [Neobacillus soli]|uniref:hypothetical protein n=1 Tax=Neobacillus soli TaxID=220688 RepID=UPI000A72CC6F|nr:hypothetical protein [Neobacillus soli]
MGEIPPNSKWIFAKPGQISANFLNNSAKLRMISAKLIFSKQFQDEFRQTRPDFRQLSN